MYGMTDPDFQIFKELNELGILYQLFYIFIYLLSTITLTINYLIF